MTQIGGVQPLAGTLHQPIRGDSGTPTGKSFGEIVTDARRVPTASREDYYNNYVKPIIENPITLTDEQIESLAQQYDPQNMSYSEYEAFLDTLVQFGVLPQKELNYLEYRGLYLYGWIGEDGQFYFNDGCATIPTDESGKLLSELSDAEGDIMVWARAYAALLNQVPLIESGTNVSSLRKAALCKNLIPILDQMSAIRKAS